ncbi:ABC transporter G family member 35 [Selaginella moellendorffii]|uniref:ABC transporter G family member 35 n=1 Tax=Selaginella moellendorffii TaxID=88036 RepID=UPI000D1C593A|nr:ABC transporter G family member 35 [Selaginella moellendorffii]|eukprot:XP_024523228.1 ABC transporter G family member 35 [Selaginella moellendorffii]
MAHSGKFEHIDAWGNNSRRGSLRSSSVRNWGIGPESVFSRSSTSRTVPAANDDEEALRWAALEKLPTYDRLRTTILKNLQGSRVVHQEIDVRNLGPLERQILMDNLIQATEEDNEKFLKKLRNRIDRVGIELPTTEVRFENVTINAECMVGGRALPTLWNAVRNTAEMLLGVVGISTGKSTTLTILKDVSGIIKPGRMTLLLGPPSSGKTTLLLALAGKLDPTLKTRGQVTYNGYELDEFVPQKTSAYISQHDLHVGEMTVRETLEFSARCQGVGTRYELLAELARREKEAEILPDAHIDLYMKATATEGVQNAIITDYTLKILGLDVCADTMVGDDMRRGISGGQKKRVTTGEMIVGPTKTLFMDEISTGLDSSTTFQIVKCLQQFAHVIEGTVFMSLLQPAPETFNLFDDIILLSEGQIVYQGPRKYVMEFFESCGFRCPDRKGIADFLQEVTSRKDQQQYWADSRRPYKYISVKEFTERFKQFHVGQQLTAELKHPYHKSSSHKAALVFKRYSVSNLELFKAGFAKEWLLVKRNSFVYVFKSVQIVIMAFVAMTVFLRTRMHQRNLNDANAYLGALFFSLITIMFNGFSEVSITITRLPVFFKQRDLLFHPAWAYTLPTYALSLPFAMIESFIWTAMTYYVEGLAPEAGRFFKHFLVLLLVHQMASSLFRCIAGLCRTMIISNTGGAFSLLVVFVLGGFIISKDRIPSWWIWGYWISPLTYADSAISINELLAPRWRQPVVNSTLTLGVKALRDRSFQYRGYWFWIGVAALVGFVTLFNVIYTLALTFLKPLGKPQAVISEESMAEIQASQQGTEYDPYAKSQERSNRRSLPRSLSSTDANNLGGVQMQRISMGREDMNLATVEGLAPKRGMILPFTPLSISFNDISYFVDMPAEMKEQGVTEPRLQLLNNVTGAFRPGVLTSLMGVSGAGKTTLMDVLAGRKTGGYIEGDIKISGYPKKQETFARISGYCEQNDIHSPQVTIRESLIFSAWLRLSKDVDADSKMQFVDEVMELVELESLGDAIVGLPGVTGLSTEQRKRLTIAVELVANPSIIFMDEPTSGLDARAAAIVMRTVRNTVDTGRTVVCTIHQPSIDIFEAFDELLLLKRGGQVVYAGPLGRNSQKLIDYFEAIPGVQKIKDGYNPATWMLEVSSTSVEQKMNVDFANIYLNSSLYQRNKALVKELSVPAPDRRDLHFSTQYSQSFYGQLKSCLWKQNWTYWRSPDYNCVRFLFTIMSALLFGSIFWNVGPKRSRQQDLFNVAGAMYGATMFLGVNNCSTVQPVVATERTVFYRERAAGMYSALPYALAQVLIEIPYIFLQTIFYAGITYSMINFEWSAAKFMWYFFVMFFTFMYFTYYGMMAVSITPNHQVAAIMASSFYSLFNLFSGFMIPKPRIPKWWIWYYWICPVAWTVYGLIASQYGDDLTPLTTPDGRRTTVKAFVESYFGYDHDFLGAVGGVLVGFSVFFAFMFAYCIKYLNFQLR